MKSLNAYILGFVLSIGFTLVAFWTVGAGFGAGMGVGILVVLAVLQLLVQLILFLHLGREPKPRWNLIAFFFALFVVVVIVGGSLWIMNNVNHEQLGSYNVFEKENIPAPNHEDHSN